MQIENESHQPKLPRVIARIKPSDSSINPTTYTSIIILDPMFPDFKACSDDSAKTFLEEDLVLLAKLVIKNSLYKELPTIKYCVYTIYQSAMIIIPLMIKLKS